jgi:hypothetical protein
MLSSALGATTYSWDRGYFFCTMLSSALGTTTYRWDKVNILICLALLSTGRNYRWGSGFSLFLRLAWIGLVS